MSPTIDHVVEAVRFSTTRKIELIRLYHRRGSTYSDRELCTRSELIDQMKKGGKVFVGRRINNLAGTFEIGERIILSGKKGAETLSIEGKTTGYDFLPEVDLF